MTKTKRKTITKTKLTSRTISSKTKNSNPKQTLKNKSSNEKIIQILTLVKNHYASLKDTIHVNAYERAIYQIKKYPNKITSGSELKGIIGKSRYNIKNRNSANYKRY
jgi:hypothetical protein